MPVIKPFTGPGSTPSRRRFWDQVTDAVEASRKLSGRFVTVDEHKGSGTVINISDSSTRRGGPGGGGTLGACCYNDGTCDDLTESDCTDAGGNWQGTGTTCDDDPNPCVGACCEGEFGDTCVDDSTPDSCEADGGTFRDFGSICDDNPCGGACCVDGECSIQDQLSCAEMGGLYFGNGSTCDIDTCDTECGTCLMPGCQIVLGQDVFVFVEEFEGDCYYCSCNQDPGCPHIDPCGCHGTHPPGIGWVIC